MGIDTELRGLSNYSAIFVIMNEGELAGDSVVNF